VAWDGADVALLCWSDCLAEALGGDKRRAVAKGAKRNKTIGFTADLRIGPPCKVIESQVARKVSGNCCGIFR
jgi:hypothetical protein